MGIAFLRNENKKYLKNIGSLQKNLSETNQEIKNTKQEIIKKLELNELHSLQETVDSDVKTKCIQTMSELLVGGHGGNAAKEIDFDRQHAINEKMVSLQETIRILQTESIATEERVTNATKGLQIMLKTAKDTIHSLQTLVSQKNESIEQYKAMIDKLLAKLKEQQSKYSQHMNAMQSKYNADQQKNDDMIMSQIQKIESQNSNRDGSEEWIQMSQIKTTLKEKQNIIKKLEDRNVALTNQKQQNLAKIKISNARINEYHQIIQELNEKIKSLSDNLSAFKTKFNSKKKENFHLQKAVKSLKHNMESSNQLKTQKIASNDDKINDEMDDKMQKMENEYKILRSSLKSELNGNKERMNEHKIEQNKLLKKNSDLILEMRTLQNTLSTKSEFLHKLQIQISKIQKDKITMQEKHSLSLKMSKKKIKNLDEQIKKLQNAVDNANQSKESVINKADFNKFKKKSKRQTIRIKEKNN